MLTGISDSNLSPARAVASYLASRHLIRRAPVSIDLRAALIDKRLCGG